MIFLKKHSYQHKMTIRWPFQAHYLLILTHFIRAQPEILIKNEKTVYAIPGNNVTLQCCILKQDGINVIQTQWTKVDASPPSRLAVYHPVYGFAKMGYNYSVNFSQQCHPHQPDLNRISNHSHSAAIYTECNQWSLQLNNVSLEQAGLYECSFATYPAGIRSSEINLIIKKPDERSSVAEILLNQTLEIPCFKGMNSSILANATWKWLMNETGNKEKHITKQTFYPPGYGTSDTVYKERIYVGLDNTLRISPVSILDDGKKFVCYITYHHGMKSTTEVKVFVKPEISVVLHTSITGKTTLTCVVRKAFPKPKLQWYKDRKILKDNTEGTFLENKDKMDGEGFHEMRLLLTIWDTFQPPIPQIFRCVAVYPFPGNELRNVSSEEIHLPLGLQTTTLASPEITPVSDSSKEGHLNATTNLEEITITKTSSYSTVTQSNQFTERVTDLTSQTILSSSPTVKSRFNLTVHLSTQRVTELTSWNTQNSSPTIKDNLTATRATEPISLISPGNSPTVKDGLNITGFATKPGLPHFSWPALVAALLFICCFFMVLGIRTWCRYQKEIMNRPPSFKPPPPPIKYTSMPECEGAYPCCRELENL